MAAQLLPQCRARLCDQLLGGPPPPSPSPLARSPLIHPCEPFRLPLIHPCEPFRSPLIHPCEPFRSPLIHPSRLPARCLEGPCAPTPASATGVHGYGCPRLRVSTAGPLLPGRAATLAGIHSLLAAFRLRLVAVPFRVYPSARHSSTLANPSACSLLFDCVSSLYRFIVPPADLAHARRRSVAATVNVRTQKL